MKNLFFNICFLIFQFQLQAQENNFQYSGEIFFDSEWGFSYKLSNPDKLVLQKTHGIMEKSVSRVKDQMGDYNVSIHDMSYPFDEAKQKSDPPSNGKCSTCYFGNSPKNGEHFRYRYEIHLEMKEGSSIYMDKYRIDDSIQQYILKLSEEKKNKSNAPERQAALQAELERITKEIELLSTQAMTPQVIDQIQEKTKLLEQKSKNLGNDIDLPKDSLHAITGMSHALLVKLVVSTNEFLTKEKYTHFQEMNNDRNFIYTPLQITGCRFACIYFDKYNKRSDRFSYTDNPVFVAYLGTVYENENSISRQWLNPSEVKVTFSGSLEQIKQLVSLVDFQQLRTILP